MDVTRDGDVAVEVAVQATVALVLAVLVAALATRAPNALLVILVGIAFATVRPQHHRATFACSVVIGLIVELVGTKAHAWAYPVTNVAALPAWLPVLWGLAGAGPVRAATAVVYRGVQTVPRRSFAVDITVLLIALAACRQLWATEPRMLALLIATGGLAFAGWRRQIPILIAGALVGSLLELIATSGGAWHYMSPSLSRIAVWVPPMWGVVAVVLSDLHRIAPCDAVDRADDRGRADSLPAKSRHRRQGLLITDARTLTSRCRPEPALAAPRPTPGWPNNNCGQGALTTLGRLNGTV